MMREGFFRPGAPPSNEDPRPETAGMVASLHANGGVQYDACSDGWVYVWHRDGGRTPVFRWTGLPVPVEHLDIVPRLIRLARERWYAGDWPLKRLEARMDAIERRLDV